MIWPRLDWDLVAKKRRILVTGVARWWGALVVQRLVEDPDVAEVIGIDIREPRYDLGRADYLKLDIRHSLIGKLVRAVGIDTVVLRVSNSLNPQEPQPLARYLDLEMVPTVAGYDPSIQLIHRDDCIHAMVLAAKRGPAGAYNIAAPAAEPLSKLLDAGGKL